MTKKLDLVDTLYRVLAFRFGRDVFLVLRLRSARPRFRLAINGDFKALAPTLALL